MSAPPFAVKVTGIPSPQGSKRAFVSKSGRAVVTESAGERLRSWREAVRSDSVAAIDAGAPSFPAGALDVHIDFSMPRPKSHYGTGKNADRLKAGSPEYCDKRPDIDKLTRSTLDALKQAGVYGDDSQVAVLTAVKYYGPAGARIVVKPTPVR